MKVLVALRGAARSPFHYAHRQVGLAAWRYPSVLFVRLVGPFMLTSLGPSKMRDSGAEHSSRQVRSGDGTRPGRKLGKEDTCAPVSVFLSSCRCVCVRGPAPCRDAFSSCPGMERDFGSPGWIVTSAITVGSMLRRLPLRGEIIITSATR